MSGKIPITVARGDGIGPEIMDATLHIILEAGAPIEPEFIEIGEKVYLAGHSAGITDDAWESLRRTKVFLKAPITTPQGGGFKSLNVTTRKTLGLYANVRPAVSYTPSFPPSIRAWTWLSSARTRKTCTRASSISKPPTWCRA